jgi:polyisoprenoid-binding protein YceI
VSIRPIFVLLLSLAFPPKGSLSVDTAGSTIRFSIVHPLHRVDGQSRIIEGRALTQGDGQVLAMVRVPVSSFRLGDASRDTHMQEVLEVGKHPFVVFKGIARLAAQTGAPTDTVKMDGELEFHGVKKPVAVPLTLQSAPDGGWRIRGGFDVSLDSHGIDRPSLLFVKLDDTCHIDLDLLLHEVKP